MSEKGDHPVEPQPVPQRHVAPTTPITYVSFSAEINANTTESLIAVMAQCAAQGVRQVYMMISTPGGMVMNGINLYNVLRAMPFELITHNVGNVDSIGNAVFLAGSKRYAVPQSTFMFHGVGAGTGPGQHLAEADLRQRLDSVLADQKRIGAIIAERTKLDATQIAELFTSAQTKDAAYAVGCGIVDEVKNVQIPPGSPIIALVFQRQGT